MEKEQVYLAALAGLLHDVGKVVNRTTDKKYTKHTIAGETLFGPGGELSHLVPQSWEQDVGDVIRYHHDWDTQKELVKYLRLADWIASLERQREMQMKKDAAVTPLIPLSALVMLCENAEVRQNGLGWGYGLPSREENSILFPHKSPILAENAYDQFLDEVFLPLAQQFPGPIDSYSRMAGWIDLLAYTLTYVPSATPWEQEAQERTTPDVPLYHHLHLTAAIAVCLYGVLPDDVEALYQVGKQRKLNDASTHVARLVKLDFSGIQEFIYRITSPRDEQVFRKTAKRLRGRSFQLVLLNRAVADWILQEMELPPTQVMYASGGIIELLLPPDERTKQRFCKAVSVVQQALWNEYGTSLGIVYADVLLKPNDFAEMRTAREMLEDALAHQKDHKWEQRTDLFQVQPIYHVCPVCGLTVVSQENQICAQCKTQEAIGDVLPRANLLISSARGVLQGVTGAFVSLPEPMEGMLSLAEKVNWNALSNSEVWGRGLNDFPAFYTWKDYSAPGRWGIANAVPVVAGEMCDFEEMAAMSRGAAYLGVLKVDADYMGLIFSRGIHPQTFSRVMALSYTIERFFGEYMNVLTRDVTRAWKATLRDEHRQQIGRRLQRLDSRFATSDFWETLDNVFYVLYAGGDDAFVLGPWDALLEFALTLRRRYRDYTCENSLFGLSAGVVLVKPHFPVQQFSHLVDKAERAAKEAGRDRLTLFGQTLLWHEMESLVGLGKVWAEAIWDKRMPRGLIHDFSRVSVSAQGKYVFTPQIYYTLIRRLARWNKEEVKGLANQVLSNLRGKRIEVPVAYASLITRKE